MTALVKKTIDSEIPVAEQRPVEIAPAGGFGPVTTPAANDNNFRRALVTMLLVLYPAMATAGVVVAALVFSGAQPIILGYGLS